MVEIMALFYPYPDKRFLKYLFIYYTQLLYCRVYNDPVLNGFLLRAILCAAYYR